MGSQQRTIDFILEQIAGAGSVSARKMFGEYGVYCDGRMVGLVCDDQLFLKPTAAGRALCKTVSEGTPYPGAKPHIVVPADCLDDSEWMSELVRVSLRALPPLADRRGARRR